MIDIERLRKILMDECMAAYFAGDIGAALVDLSYIERASAEELIKTGERLGIRICTDE